jgi:mannose-6-phosphate isomerase-like protein (cupin superfamily)
MMPLIRPTDNDLPAWCEMRHYEIVRLNPGETHTFERRSPKEKLIVGEGQCRISFGGQTVEGVQKTNLDISAPGDQFEITGVTEPTVLVRMGGDWGEERGGSGLFSVEASDNPKDKGDPVDYPKNTNLDSHYHDCDEYWIILSGRGEVVSEGKQYPAEPGDCLAIGMGHHHDFPLVYEPVRAVYFETTLQGQKRRGHLWNHTHGPAQPQWDRV